MPIMSRAEKASYDDAVDQVPTKLPMDGTGAMEGDLDMGSNKVSQVGAGTASTDATNLGQVDSKFALGSLSARRRQFKGR